MLSAQVGTEAQNNITVKLTLTFLITFRSFCDLPVQEPGFRNQNTPSFLTNVLLHGINPIPQYLPVRFRKRLSQTKFQLGFWGHFISA